MNSGFGNLEVRLDGSRDRNCGWTEEDRRAVESHKESLWVHQQVSGVLLDRETMGEACWKVVRRLAAKSKLASGIRDGVIQVFGRSKSFNAAAENARKLKILEPFSNDQLNQIVRVSSRNNQIYLGFEARRYVRDLIRPSKPRINAKQLREFLKLSSPG
jgi:hypothetical protein